MSRMGREVARSISLGQTTFLNYMSNVQYAVEVTQALEKSREAIQSLAAYSLYRL